MLDSFEARLADLFADLLAGEAGLHPPLRTSPAAPPATLIQPVLRVLTASAPTLVGDDAPRVRRLPGGLGLRTVLEFEGTVAIDLIPAVDIARPARMTALDQVLVALQAAEVRSGAAFADGTDQGFLLRGFRLAEVIVEGEAAPLRALFRYEGDFWPVRPDEDGPAIASIPARLAVLPVQAGATLVARAGGPDLTIPVALDLRSMTLPRLGAGEVRLVARLRGAAPPGSLVGDAAAAPGFTAYPVEPDGVARLVFRPPAVAAAVAMVGIEVALEGAGRARVALAEIGVRVLP
ncbi:MAG: hypothetical protein IT555_05870 [Acetobacteraceae bacterium]|nr:hypothetical protein [Acetobacteraceae bacterium]